MIPFLIMFLARGQCVCAGGYVFGVEHVSKYDGEWF